MACPCRSTSVLRSAHHTSDRGGTVNRDGGHDARDGPRVVATAVRGVPKHNVRPTCAKDTAARGSIPSRTHRIPRSHASFLCFVFLAALRIAVLLLFRLCSRDHADLFSPITSLAYERSSSSGLSSWKVRRQN